MTARPEPTAGSRRVAIRIDVMAGSGSQNEKLERRVAERAGEHVAKLAGRVRVGEIDHEVAHDGPVQARAQQADEERHGKAPTAAPANSAAHGRASGSSA